MSNSSHAENQPKPQNAASGETFIDETSWDSTAIVKQVLHGFASLRLTVALLAMAIFIVLAGTLGQVHRDIWDVIHDYFRMNLSDTSPLTRTISLMGKEIILPSPLTWIDLSIFFPPSFCPDHVPPDLSPMMSQARVISSLVMGFGWAGLVWLLPLRDKKLQLGIFAALGATLALLMTVGSSRTYPVSAQDRNGQLQINLDIPSARTFTITIAGETSVAINHDATVATIQTAVDEITGVTDGDFTVTKPTETTVRVKANPAGKFGNEAVTMSAVLIARPGGFWFPKGWTIGALMALNLLAAHLMRFKIQSSGARLWAGVGVIGLGVLAIFGVIMSGSNKEGVLKENFLGNIELDWSTIWVVFEFTLAIVLVLGIYGYISLWRRTLSEPNPYPAHRSATVTMRRIAGIGNLILAGVLVYFVQGGSDTQLSESGMRILWQLLKATVAGLIFLGGCALVFRKRAGVVVLHSGVALIMFSELLVGVAAVETQMQIVEGESANFVQDIREIEVAVIDPSDPEVDHVVAIPQRFLKKDALIQDDRLPVNIRVDVFYPHSFPEKIQPDDENPATDGVGLERIAKPAQGSTGTDNASKVNMASAYVTLFSKTDAGENDRNLGTWLISQYYNEQDFKVDGKTYDFALRFKRIYKPYTITLKEANRENYVGTATPRDYRSIIDLKDPTRNEDRKDVHIWMNNPLRFAGETFYQSGLEELRPGVDITTFSVVTNDGWMIPYVACMIVAVGMLAHFMIALLRFLNRDAKPAVRSPKMLSAIDPIQEPSNIAWLTPALSIGLVLVFGGYLASKARPPQSTEEGFDFYKAGQIPVSYEGRVKPLDTLARNSLRVMSNKQEFTDLEGNPQPAMRWLMDLIVDPEEADKHPVFRIDYQPLADALKLPKRKGYLYSYAEIMKEGDEFRRQLSKALATNEKVRGTYQMKVMELARRTRLRDHLAAAFHHQKIEGLDAFNKLVQAFSRNDELQSIIESDHVAMPLMASQATGEWEQYGIISLRFQILKLAEKHQAKDARELSVKLIQDYTRPLAANAIKRLRQGITEKALRNHQTFAETAASTAEVTNDPRMKQVYALLAESKPRDTELEIASKLSDPVVRELSEQEAMIFLPKSAAAQGGSAGQRAMGMMEMIAERTITKVLDGKPLSEFSQEAPFEEIFASYQAGHAEDFNKAVDAYHSGLVSQPPVYQDKPISVDRLTFESFFNNAAPFYYLAAIYLIAGLLAAASWLTRSQPLNRATFWLLCFCLVVHTAALAGRIYISGRPPVTTLYSSAVFIGWGCVLMGLLFEWFYDMGMGNLVAAVAGFLTLGVAHLLTTEVASFRGDTFPVLLAVLDTQFWLATHVVCISMGYATTYMAGLMGAAYILGGAFTPMLTAPRRKDLLRMIYGTLCFAIFFSFVGTVLGGLWADDSWGRFWGWDTKENGALIIVLWNALVLHARWGGIVKERGLACLVVAGNICVSWSWFGVNELGIGLHSYGFTEGVLPKLALFCVSQMLLIGIGSLPKEYWWSHIAEQSEAKA